MPVSTRKEFNFKSPKKKKRVIMVKNQNNINTQQLSLPSGNSRIPRVKAIKSKNINLIFKVLYYIQDKKWQHKIKV